MASLGVSVVLAAGACSQSRDVKEKKSGSFSIVRRANSFTHANTSTIRGANYRGAGAADTTDYWHHYNASVTERDLTLPARAIDTASAWKILIRNCTNNWPNEMMSAKIAIAEATFIGINYSEKLF